MIIGGPKLSDIGMQQYNPKPKPAPIKAAPTAKLTYDTPQVSTYSPNNGWSNPVGTYYPTTQSYPTTTWNGPANAAATTPTGPATVQANIDTAPKVVTPPRKSFDDIAGEYKGHDDKLAQVDSTFMDQKSMYAAALKKYLADYGIKVKGVNDDADTAREGIALNKNRGLTSLWEDMASRGIARSGIAAKEVDQATDAYGRQKANIDTGQERTLSDLAFQKGKYEGENGENGSNMGAARREAYARLVAKQDL